MSSTKSKLGSKNTDKSKAQSAPPMRIFDVARPGTLPPADATARPVIVTNRVVMQDPMMVPKVPSEVAGKEVDTQDFTKLSNKLVVKPLDAQETDVDDSTKSKSGDEAETDESSGIEQVAYNDANNDAKATASDGSSNESDDSDESDKSDEKPPAASTATNPDTDPETKAETQAKPDTEDKQQDESTDRDSDAPSSQTVLDKEAAQLEADAKAQDEIDTLVDQKTYFLPINSVEKRRSKHVFIFGILIIVILTAAWLDIALDAGFIDIPGLKPLTHLFRN